jgi:hypothetical protein
MELPGFRSSGLEPYWPIGPLAHRLELEDLLLERSNPLKKLFIRCSGIALTDH